MAKIPSIEEVKDNLNHTEAEIESKVVTQAEIDKTFVLPAGGGSGVIPEEVWQNLPGRNIDNPEAVS